MSTAGNITDGFTVIDLDPEWRLEELTPVVELYDAQIRLEERIEGGTAFSQWIVAVPGAVDPEQILHVIADSVNDTEADYG